MANKNDNKQLVLTPQEVQDTLNNGTNSMNGYTPITPLDTSGSVPQSAAWRDVQLTGKAKTDYKNILGAQPGAYKGYGQQIGQTMNNLLGQRPFNYDVNTDALYQQIKDNYIKQGKQAMMDTQGASAALTGGYGNSYGAMAGQQAYQNSLGDLSAQIPQLYQLAYNRYLGDENSQRQNLAALQGLDESAYQRYQYDTQQYETKLADLYKKSQSGSGKKKLTLEQFMNNLYGFYGADDGSYNSQSGLKGDAGVDAAQAAGVITKEEAEWYKQGGKELTNRQRYLQMQAELEKE